jgi:CDP-diacylglycerol--glycerol-3-phosphate 3-phosphatidyltransferase
MRRHIPNLLTGARLVLAAAFFVLLELYAYPARNAHLLNAATGLFIVAAITDALDGYLARRWQVESTFGRIIDPFADKVLVLGAFIYLAGPGFASPAGESVSGVAPWMVVVVLARELLVTAIRGQVEAMGVRFGAVWSGKIKMILQSIVVPIVLLLVANADPTEHAWSASVRDVLVWATVAATVASGVPYVRNAYRALAEAHDGKDGS